MFNRNTKEKIISAGVLLACGLLIALAVRCVFIGGYGLIFALVFGLIPVAIYKGLKFGYIMARVFFGGLAVLIGGNVINPLAYHEISIAGNYYCWAFLFIASSLFILAYFLFYCLGEHARLRKRVKAQE